MSQNHHWRSDQKSWASSKDNAICKIQPFQLLMIDDFILRYFYKFWFRFTDLGSLIRNIHCENFRIFLPLRFYVKSILVLVKPKKLLFEPFEQLWILNLWNFFYFFECEIILRYKIQSLQIAQDGSFWPSEISQNWIHVKSEWQGNC